jgi:outer membrane autotransporter protein
MMSRSHLYGIANLYSEFFDRTKVDVSGVGFTSAQERVLGGLGAGGTSNWSGDKYSLYGEGLMTTSLKNFGESYFFKGNVGFRLKWLLLALDFICSIGRNSPSSGELRLS